jgi:hypothetical protein
MEASREVNILERADKPRDVPPEIRKGFVVKVYSLVVTMLLISFGLASPFVFYAEAASKWLDKNIWVLFVTMSFFLVQYLIHTAMMMQMCCGCGDSCFRCYIKMFVTVPFNYTYMLVYSVFTGALIGMVSLMYQAESVCLVFIVCAVIIIALTIYAVYTNCDFTGFGAYIFVALIGLMLLSVIGFFVPIGSTFHRVLGGLGAIIFGWIIVYDTQLIFGTASASENRKYEYTIDMYAFASFELYLDFINFFLYMLRLLGARR